MAERGAAWRPGRAAALDVRDPLTAAALADRRARESLATWRSDRRVVGYRAAHRLTGDNTARTRLWPRASHAGGGDAGATATVPEAPPGVGLSRITGRV